MGGLLQRATGLACAFTLAASMVPVPAFATVQAANVAHEKLQQRAQEVDAHEGAFQDGAIIVVYARDAKPSQQASDGLAVQSVSVAGIPDATAQVLSENSNVEGGGPALHVDLPEGVSVGQAVAAAEADPDVVYAQPIYQYRPMDLPNDEFLKDKTNSGSSPNAWWIYSVKAPEAWDIAHTDNQVTVAVLDTGINFTHEDLQDNILADYAYDAYLDMPLLEAPTAQPTSEMGHGSHVAGIVAARANNSVGTAGVTYNANVLPICVFHEVESMLGSRAACNDEDLIRAYDYLLSDEDGDGRTVAEETNTRVVNMSLGGYIADDPLYEYDYLFEDKIEEVQDAGILTVAAGGNGDDYGNPRTDASYPSDYDAVMSVVALKNDTERAYWSDYNNAKDIAAPGVDIYSTWYYGNQYHFSSGTSMASPLVAGGAALLWAYNPELSVMDLKSVLYSTADDLGGKGLDAQYGWGRMNLKKAIESLGTVMVKAESASMMRTATQQLSAQVIANAAEDHQWLWSVSDASVARITTDGKLTALSAGTVEVRVEAADNAQLSGKRTITVEDIHIEGGITASANPADNTIALRWAIAQSAVSYQIMRATAQAGPYQKLAQVSASEVAGEEGNATYVDATARASVEYWYKVVPVGQLDGQAVEGAESNAARGYYTDKSALRQKITEAEGLLSSTKTSADGSNVSASEYWTTVEARTALNQALRDAYSAYYSGALLQDAVDASTQALTDAVDTFQGQRAKGTSGAASPSPSPAPTPTPAPTPSGNTSSGQAMYRLYNPYTGEHFYTASATERDGLAAAGWKAEGTAWNAPSDSSTAVYRVYNPYSGDHHYTTSAAERNNLVSVGWRNEGIGWFSDDAKGVGLYRLYNPNAVAGAHHYTSSAAERDSLVAAGWRAEGIGWYGAK